MQKQWIGLVILTTCMVLHSCKPKGFTKLKSGLEYQIVKDEKGDKKAVEGSFMKAHVETLLNDSVVSDTRKASNNEPITIQVTKPGMSGDLMEGFPLLSAGDSALFKYPADSMFKDPNQRPPFVKKGDMVYYRVKLVAVMTEAEMEADQKKASAEQDKKDEVTIQEYITKNNLAMQKTPSGIYYQIEKPGNDKHPTLANEVEVHYKGTLLDGTVFDSSYDRKEPAKFPLGNVIKGWREGIPLFGEGGKGKLIIPSSLAYGANPQPGSPIKPNSVLLFEVELLRIVK
jgi:FKBP-type peptidyl-prolyl cis-trans isomerase FkpA